MNRKFLVDLAKDWGIALGVAMIAFILWAWATAPSAPALGPAPDFTLTDLEGQAVSLDALDDEVVVLNFWFTSCAPCRHEIPELAAFHDQHPEVALYGISVDRNMPTERLAAMSDRLGINYPVLHDADVRVARTYDVSVFPTTVVVRDGEIRASRVGEVDQRRLAAMVDQARP